jgi:Glyceraldehyde-3-phosphate dehydrogenase/erythrose-4-phosphate dehydrogenase
VVAINDVAPPATLARLLAYDPAFGRPGRQVLNDTYDRAAERVASAAARTGGLVLPEPAGALDGIAVRAPVEDGSAPVVSDGTSPGVLPVEVGNGADRPMRCTGQPLGRDPGSLDARSVDRFRGGQ